MAAMQLLRDLNAAIQIFQTVDRFESTGHERLGVDASDTRPSS
jgi:hypothetical protein